MALALMIENMKQWFSPYIQSEKDIPKSHRMDLIINSIKTKITTITYSNSTIEKETGSTSFTRQRQLKNPAQENRLTAQRLHKEYMNHIRERAKNAIWGNLIE